MLEEGIQDFIKKIGDKGCYALCLCRIAELYSEVNADPIRPGWAVSAIKGGINAKCIGDDMTVLDGTAYLDYITCGIWGKEYKAPDYKPIEGDYLVAEWFNPRTKLAHFTVEYPVKWNSLKNSVTVKEGSIRSYRLYREVKRIRVFLRASLPLFFLFSSALLSFSQPPTLDSIYTSLDELEQTLLNMRSDNESLKAGHCGRT